MRNSIALTAAFLSLTVMTACSSSEPIVQEDVDSVSSKQEVPTNIDSTEEERLSYSSSSVEEDTHESLLKFSCKWDEPSEAWVTFTEVEKRGTIRTVSWVTDTFSDGGYNQETRCSMVTQKFQKFYDAGDLNNIYIGEFKRASSLVRCSRSGSATGTR